MRLLDWSLFFGFLAYVVWDGMRSARRDRDATDYFLAGRAVPWWAIGLSIMATQASAITMIGTTGQGWADGMRFVQFYFALPIAMVILAFTAVPLYHRLQVRTPYEYLGRRFDEKTRRLSALLFLLLRCMSVGLVIYAPSLVLARVCGLPFALTVLLMGGVAVLYTSVGGLNAVIRTDVKQMTVMVLGLVVALAVLVLRLPEGAGPAGAWTLAAEAKRLTIVDLTWDPAEKYTLWSSLLGGLFLFLSYFGTDHSQVQRLLAGRSVRHTQGALLMNALLKIPFQALVLSCGVLLFAFHVLAGAPLAFEPGAERQAAALPVEERREYHRIASEYEAARSRLSRVGAELVTAESVPPALGAEFRSLVARSAALRDRACALRGGAGDVNYVFLDFILRHLPTGLVGLLLAAIFAAALSSIDSELNALTSVAMLDIYQPLRRVPLEGVRLLRLSRLATLAVGAFATAFALYIGRIGSLIEAVNEVGSYVYGSLLGAFVLAAIPRANGRGAFVGLLAGMAAVAVAARTGMAFLYLNTIGVAVVVVVGTLVSPSTGRRAAGGPGRPTTP